MQLSGNVVYLGMEKEITIGSRVRLTEPQQLFNKSFPKGHEFTVYSSSYRGWDLIDDNGNKMDECLFIHDKLELIQSPKQTG